MSATEIIEQIKALPKNEWQEIKDFVDTLEIQPARAMDRDKALQISRRIMAENHELFRKLAQ